jgi:ABC-2 type transport system ATP-binding protein
MWMMSLPPSLRPQLVAERDGRVTLRLSSAAEVESALAACREAGVGIDELEVGHADLEDVFLQLMHDDRARVAA